jgi:hypothetical protein
MIAQNRRTIESANRSHAFDRICGVSHGVSEAKELIEPKGSALRKDRFEGV